MRKHINLKETDQKNEETHKKYWEIPRKYWEIPRKYWEIPRKYLNKIKRKRIYNSGKSIKKKRKRPKNLNLEGFLKNLKKSRKNRKKNLLLRGFRLFLIRFRVEAFPCHHFVYSETNKSITY